MPYKSRAQQGWAHTSEGMKALGGAAKVAEWDSASKGMKLPERVPQNHTMSARQERAQRKREH